MPSLTEEGDGTLEWEATTLVVVEVEGGGMRGLGYGYADVATATLIDRLLRKVVTGRDAMAPTASYIEMRQNVRNLGSAGIASMAISAVDVALWDLKARLLGLPLVMLLGAVRPSIMAYGSGGFTTYSDDQLRDQMCSWVENGMRAVKMKVGRDPQRDVHRVAAVREAIIDADLFVDANGAYSRKQALRFAEDYAALGVTWFEEPVTSDDLEGLNLLRDRAPAGLEIAAGEYAYELECFRRMLESGCVDVLQADATRCGGVTGFMESAAVCDAFGLPLSAHTAPSLHTHLCCAAPRARHVEYFFDHARIEPMFFDGACRPSAGNLKPNLTEDGLGLEFRRSDATTYQVFQGTGGNAG